MPLMYEQNTLQMEWCLNCHRNPAVNLRPTSEIYNMAWAGPSSDKPVWCASVDKNGPTSQNVSCTTEDPSGANPKLAMMQLESPTPSGLGKPQSGTNLQPHPLTGEGLTSSDVPAGVLMPASYTKFTSQMELGKYLTAQYHIRGANELSSCETCHR
jgi:hypothetical protein